MSTRYYITTAIEYANGEPHLGHALEKVAADAVARFHRLLGDEVDLLVGTDEHGQKVAQAAVAAGVSPAEQAEASTAAFRRAWDELGISYTAFSRTTEPRHEAGVLALIRRILERDPTAFYEQEYDGWYCVGCEAFKKEHELDAGRCPLHSGRPLERVAERNWFFRLSGYEGFIRDLLTDRPEFIQPTTRRNEVRAFVERGLEDVSITRASIDWGIPFPLPDREGRHQAIYVWFDALPNYLTSAGFPEPGWEARWPAQVHVVGKDITRFHCVLWPAVLHAAGLPLPDQVRVHGFLSAEGQRLSKSEGVWVELADACHRFGPETLRYYLLREVPFAADGDFSWQRLEARHTADLANTLGNLVSRVTALVARHCPGGLPPCPAGSRGPEEEALHDRQLQTLDEYRAAFLGFDPRAALESVFATLAAGNEYVSRSAPWALAKDPARRGELERCLFALTQLLARAAVLLAPALPSKSEAIWSSLGGPGSVHAQRWPQLPQLDVSDWRVVRCPPLFPRDLAPWVDGRVLSGYNSPSA